MDRRLISALLVIIALSIAGYWCYSEVQSTRSTLEIMRENVLRKKNDLANEQKSREDFKVAMNAYKDELGRFKNTPDLVQIGVKAAQKVAKDEAKGLVASAIDFYRTFRKESSRQQVDTTAGIVDSLTNVASNYIATKAEDHLIKKLEEYVNSSFSNALTEYNDSAQLYNSALTTSKFTVWYYEIKREPYLSDDGSVNELRIKN